MKQSKTLIAGAICGAALLSVGVHAYSTYAKWSSSPTFYLNPQNADGLDTAGVEASIKAGIDAWNTQSGSSFHGNYGGRVSDTSTGYDGRNVTIFRNESNGGAIATTYSWWSSSNTLLDSDIIFWDGGFTFFNGSAGCTGGAYIEDIAAHEYGHALGLNHSSDAAATMYPSYGSCSQNMRTLDTDDIAGAQALYPGGSAGGSTNTAPVVSIASPGNGSSAVQGVALTFSGSASDKEQGSLANTLIWTSNLEGQLGTGASFTKALSVLGTHTITASTTDSGGLPGASQVNVAVTATSPTPSTPPPPSGPALSARGYKVKGMQKTDLTWTGFGSSVRVNIYRSSVTIGSTASSTYTDSLNRKGAGSYVYQVCDGNSVCSNQVTVTF